MKVFKKIIFFASILITVFSCKSDLEKIDINNVEAHRAYQDSLMNRDSTNPGKFLAVKGLINDYKKLNLKENSLNGNYNYYLARLYSQVNSLPFKGFWVDSISNKFLNDRKDYSNFYDSTYYYAEKALQIDKDNIRSMFTLSTSMYFERLRYNYDTSIVPISRDRDQKKWSDRCDFITNNAIKFQKLDTTKDKYLSRVISEVALKFVDESLAFYRYKYDETNDNIVNLFYMYGQLWDYIKSEKPALISFKKKEIESDYPSVILARKLIKRRELIANASFKHKYFYYDANSGYSSLIELYTDTDFTIVSTGGFNFHGTYSIKNDYIYFSYANKSMNVGDVIIDADESVAPSKIKYEILDNGTINLISEDGNVYRQRDN
jgi:hypothetical protein